MPDETERFYATLSANYQLIFADWRSSVRRQGGLITDVLRAALSESRRAILDCACGIGTQAIGLALNGYQVHGTDLSPEAIEQARHNAESFGITMTFGVADFRHLEELVAGTFDAVICCDNSIAHLHTDADLARAFQSMSSKIDPGGLLLVSLRDYDRLVQERPRSYTPTVADRDFGRSIMFQIWDWSDDGKSYRLSHFTLKQAGEGWETICAISHLRAWQRAEIMAALAQTDLIDITWHMPEATGYHQPIFTARKPA